MDDDVKAAVLRLCEKGELALDLVNVLLQKEFDKQYGMPKKWDRVVEESGLEGEAKEKLRAIVQQVLEEKGGPV